MARRRARPYLIAYRARRPPTSDDRKAASLFEKATLRVDRRLGGTDRRHTCGLRPQSGRAFREGHPMGRSTRRRHRPAAGVRASPARRRPTRALVAVCENFLSPRSRRAFARAERPPSIARARRTYGRARLDEPVALVPSDGAYGRRRAFRHFRFRAYGPRARALTALCENFLSPRSRHAFA